MTPDPWMHVRVRVRVFCADVIGVEICGSLKNVLAIAAGIVEGLELGPNAMAALVAQVGGGRGGSWWWWAVVGRQGAGGWAGQGPPHTRRCSCCAAHRRWSGAGWPCIPSLSYVYVLGSPLLSTPYFRCRRAAPRFGGSRPRWAPSPPPLAACRVSCAALPWRLHTAAVGTTLLLPALRCLRLHRCRCTAPCTAPHELYCRPGRHHADLLRQPVPQPLRGRAPRAGRAACRHPRLQLASGGGGGHRRWGAGAGARGQGCSQADSLCPVHACVRAGLLCSRRAADCSGR